MKIIPLRAALVTALVAALTALGAPTAVADDDATIYTPLGSQAELVTGGAVQGWTISDLKPAADAIPHPVAGTLWEATAGVVAIQGTVTPVVADLYARTRSGWTYRVLLGAATAEGINPATLTQGQTTTGKIYFDITGEGPDSVVYHADGRDVAVWVQPPPGAPTASTPPTSATPGLSNGNGVPIDERYQADEELENIEGGDTDEPS